MATSERIVRHLRLKAADETQIRSAVVGLEDALRCASLPDTGERMLLVRRLDLGRLPAGLSPQTLSLLIEQRVKELGATWVHGGGDDAARSDAVFFTSRLEAAQIALRRRSAGLSLTAWYWPRVFPNVAIEAPDADFLRQLVECLGRDPGAPVALPALLADAVAQGALAWLVRHATQDTVSALISLTGVQHHLPRTRSDAAGGFALSIWSGERSEIVIGDSVAPAWLIAVLRHANISLRPEAIAVPSCSPADVSGSSLPISPRRPLKAGRGNRKVVSEQATPSIERPAVETQPLKARARVPPVKGRQSAEADDATTVKQSGHHKPQSKQWPARREETPPLMQGYPPLDQPSFDTSLPTAAGGLLFLINVLRRLGFPAWQERHIEAPMCGLILAEALRRLRVEEGDPVWLFVAGLTLPEAPAPRLWESPLLWSDPRIGLALPQSMPIAPATMAALWLAACRRFLRRIARIGLASLCLRQARVEWTETHIDTILPLFATDLRVRREGLDIDPGWLDWLGWVVSYRYDQGGDW